MYPIAPPNVRVNDAHNQNYPPNCQVPQGLTTTRNHSSCPDARANVTAAAIHLPGTRRSFSQQLLIDQVA